MKPQFIRLIWIAVVVVVAAGCTQEPTARKDQERAFTQTFGFPPTGEIADISYHSASAWAPNFGGYLSLMRFTYVPSIVERIDQKYGLSLQSAAPATVEKPPEWWRKPSPQQQIFYAATNGVVRCLWIDREHGFVFYQEFNVD
jgi:hypothetical protein